MHNQQRRQRIIGILGYIGVALLLGAAATLAFIALEVGP